MFKRAGWRTHADGDGERAPQRVAESPHGGVLAHRRRRRRRSALGLRPHCGRAPEQERLGARGDGDGAVRRQHELQFQIEQFDAARRHLPDGEAPCVEGHRRARRNEDRLAAIAEDAQIGDGDKRAMLAAFDCCPAERDAIAAAEPRTQGRGDAPAEHVGVHGTAHEHEIENRDERRAHEDEFAQREESQTQRRPRVRSTLRPGAAAAAQARAHRRFMGGGVAARGSALVCCFAQMILCGGRAPGVNLGMKWRDSTPASTILVRLPTYPYRGMLLI